MDQQKPLNNDVHKYVCMYVCMYSMYVYIPLNSGKSRGSVYVVFWRRRSGREERVNIEQEVCVCMYVCICMYVCTCVCMYMYMYAMHSGGV